MKPSLVDIHCHILPGVDDGAKDMDMALEMLRKEAEDGVSDVILTPHFVSEHEADYNYAQRFAELKEKVKEAFPELTLHLGRELFFSHSIPDLLESGRLQYMGDSNYALIEFAPDSDYQYIYRSLTYLSQSGVQPVLAHVDRVNNVGTKQATELVKSGIYIQVNAGSIYGKNGFRTRRKVQKLLQSGLIHFVGSDAHNTTSRAPDMKEAYEYTQKKYGRGCANAIFIDNPHQMLQNQYL